MNTASELSTNDVTILLQVAKVTIGFGHRFVRPASKLPRACDRLARKGWLVATDIENGAASYTLTERAKTIPVIAEIVAESK